MRVAVAPCAGGREDKLPGQAGLVPARLLVPISPRPASFHFHSMSHRCRSRFLLLAAVRFLGQEGAELEFETWTRGGGAAHGKLAS